LFTYLSLPLTGFALLNFLITVIIGTFLTLC
jgi:hypothetical protein